MKEVTAMTSTDRDIGRMEGKLDSMSNEMGAIHSKLDKILGGECVTGKKNADSIEKLGIRIGKVEQTIGKAILAGFAVLGSGHGIGWLAEILLK